MENFIRECLAYCEARGLAKSSFGNYVANDGKFLERLERGGQCLPRTMDRVRAYMAANAPEQTAHDSTSESAA